MTWELAVDVSRKLGPVALLTGHPDTLSKQPPDHVQVDRALAYRRGSSLTRMLCWFGYSLQALVWLWRWPARTPVLVFSNPPVMLWFMRWMHGWRGTPYVVMVHDIYPDVLVRKGALRASGRSVRIWRWLNRRGYESADAVLTLGPYLRQNLVNQWDASRTKLGHVEVVPPWGNDTSLHPKPKSANPFAIEHGLVDKITVMYSGNMGWGHDIESILEAAGSLTDVSALRFVMIGDGPKWNALQRDHAETPKPNVCVLPWQQESMLPWTLTAADIGIVSLEDELCGLAVPSKAYSFLVAGVPLIAICSPDCELAELVGTHGCGAVVPPHSPQLLREVLWRMVQEPETLRQWKKAAVGARGLLGREQATTAIVEVLRSTMQAEPASRPARGTSSLLTDWLKRPLMRLACHPLVGRCIGAACGDRIRHHGCTIATDSPEVVPSLKAALFWGSYEKSETRFVQQYLPKDLPVLELGSSLGVVSSHIARHLLPGGELVCVEANPHLLGLIRRNVEHNAPHVTLRVVHAAVDYSGSSTVRLRVARRNTDSTVAQVAGPSDTLVPVTTLTQLRQGLSPGPFAIVCDIEGAELDVIRQERDCLAECQCLVIELHRGRRGDQDYSPESMEAILIREHGFRLVARRGNVRAFDRDLPRKGGSGWQCC